MTKLPENFVPKTPGQQFKLEWLRALEAAGRGKGASANQLRDELLQESRPNETQTLIAHLGGPRAQ